MTFPELTCAADSAEFPSSVNVGIDDDLTTSTEAVVAASAMSFHRVTNPETGAFQYAFLIPAATGLSSRVPTTNVPVMGAPTSVCVGNG